MQKPAGAAAGDNDDDDDDNGDLITKISEWSFTGMLRYKPGGTILLR